MNNTNNNELTLQALTEQIRQEVKQHYLQTETQQIENSQQQNAQHNELTTAHLLQSQSDTMALMAQTNAQVVAQLNRQLLNKDRQLNILLDRIQSLEQENNTLKTCGNEGTQPTQEQMPEDTDEAEAELSRSQKPALELLWQLCFRAGITDAAKSDLARLMAYLTGWSEKKIYNLLKGENHILLERSNNSEIRRLNLLLQRLNTDIRLPGVT